MDAVVSWVLPSLLTIAFWYFKQATPGKMVVGARLQDVTTGECLSLGQCIGRYLATFISIFALFLGILWIVFDQRKQAWHDKLAGSVVVRAQR
jgi:uncharacterized RDD family membrane protein YckC